MKDRFDEDIDLPKGIDLFELRSYLEITYDGDRRRRAKRKNAGDVFGRMFVIIWCMLWVGMPLINIGPTSLFFTLIPLLMVLRTFFQDKKRRDRTRIKSAKIRVNPYRIHIEKKYARGISRLKKEEIDVEDVEDLIFEQKRGIKRASFSNSYSLKAKLKNGKVVDILDDIDTEEQAVFIKERMIAFMNKEEDAWLNELEDINASPMDLDLDKDVKRKWEEGLEDKF